MKKIITGSILLLVFLSIVGVVYGFNEKGAPSLTIIEPGNPASTTNGSMTFIVQGNGNISSATVWINTESGSYAMTSVNETNFRYVLSSIPISSYNWYVTATMKNETGVDMNSSGRAGNFSSLSATSSVYQLNSVRSNSATTTVAALVAAAETNPEIKQQLTGTQSAGFFNQKIGTTQIPVWLAIVAGIAIVFVFSRKGK